MTPTFKIAERNSEGLFSLLDFTFYSYHDAKMMYDEFSVGKSLRDLEIMQAIWAPILSVYEHEDEDAVYETIYDVIGWTFA